MPAAWTPVARDQGGIEDILLTLSRLKNYYGVCPCVRMAALEVAGSTVDDDQAGHVARLAHFVRSSVTYVADPLHAEWIRTPDLMLLEIHNRNKCSGDCDDHCLLFASCCESLGIPCEIVSVVSVTGVTFDHVICVVTINGEQFDIDLCAKGGYQPDYPEKLFVA